MKRSLQKFIGDESAGGRVMLLATALALVVANSSAASQYASIIALPIAGLSVQGWITDALMVLFFFAVGMELKREMVEGVLTDRKQIALPLVAALGGMILPALIFLSVNGDIPEYLNGWAIPTATDIAFALAILLMVSKRVSPALKIFLLAIAIFDDLGAILIIALFYSDSLHMIPLLIAVAATQLLMILNRMHASALWPYLLLGFVLCIALHEAGIHTTIGGVITGLTIPMRHKFNAANSPLNRCLETLHPYVAFGVLPLFAFTTAGISLHGITLSSLSQPLPLGILLGLFFGKQLGIFGASALLILSGKARLPKHVRWRELYAVSILAGIGFTMSLFIGALAFEDAALALEVKLGVLSGSALSAGVGGLLLWAMGRR